MSSQLMRRRGLQVCLLLAVALLFSRVPQWEHGVWVLISVGAIIGPFSPLLTFRKSMLRALGTTAGLLLSAILITAFSHLPWMIPILGVLLAYGVAFTSQQDYRYFIMIVTVAIALNFADMYVPYTPFEPLSFFASRAMGVFIGITLYVVLEWVLFGRREMKRWMLANNAEFETVLAKAAETLRHNKSQRPNEWLPELAVVTEAQQKHAESLSGLSADMDDEAINDTMREAQRLQRLGKRLQMSFFRAVRLEQSGSEASELAFDCSKRAMRLAYLISGARH